MKLSDYAAIEEARNRMLNNLILFKIVEPDDEVKAEDLDTILITLNVIQDVLLDKDTDEERVEFLFNYVTALCGKMVFNYGATTKDF